MRATRRRRGDRGATLPEYAIILAAFVVVGLAGLTTLNDNADSYFEDTSSKIGQPDQDVVTGGGEGGGGGGSSTTTTAAIPEDTNVSLTDESYDPLESNHNRWALRVRAHVQDNLGNNIEDAIVTARVYHPWGSWFYRTCTTASDGTCVLAANPYWYNEPYTVRVVDVEAVPSWDGVAAELVVPKPPYTP